MSVARLPLLRLARSKEAWSLTAGWTALTLAAAWANHRHGSVHGADRALDLYAAVVVPLLVYGLVSVELVKVGLVGTGRPLVRLGANAGRVARATVLTTMVASALVTGLLGAVTVVVAHGSGDPPVAHDALVTFAIGALGGGTYAAYFSLAGSIVAAFWGRALFLVLDWILGADDGFGALLTPRGHLRNLLGGDAPFDLAPAASLVALGLLATVCAVLAVARAARGR